MGNRIGIKTLSRLPLSCAIGARAAKTKLCESTIVMGPWRDGFAVRGMPQQRQPTRQQPQKQLLPRQSLPLLQQQQPQPQLQPQQLRPRPRRPQLPLQPRLQPQQLQPQLQPRQLRPQPRQPQQPQQPLQPLQPLQPRPRLRPQLQPRQLRPRPRPARQQPRQRQYPPQLQPLLQPVLQPRARQPPARRPGNGVLVNTTDILLIRIALKPTSVSAEGRSAMGMETPGPSQNKWMEALSAQMRFLEPILCFAKGRSASVNRVQPRRALQR